VGDLLLRGTQKDLDLGGEGGGTEEAISGLLQVRRQQTFRGWGPPFERDTEGLEGVKGGGGGREGRAFCK
jgi:hypothetical protein